MTLGDFWYVLCRNEDDDGWKVTMNLDKAQAHDLEKVLKAQGHRIVLGYGRVGG